MKIISDTPNWIIFASFLFSLIIGFLLYYKNKWQKDIPISIIWSLRLMRTFSVFLLILLLLGLTFEFKKIHEEKPVFIVLTDNSLSMRNYSDSNSFQSNIKNFKSNLEQTFGDKFEYIYKSIGSKITADKNDFIDIESNLYQGFDEIQNNYNNANIGGIVLISDGNYNVGDNPIYAAEKIPITPIYTLGVGDTIPKIDQSIKNITSNSIILLNNQFEFEVDVEASKMNKRSSTLTLYSDGKEIKRKKLTFSDTSYTMETHTFLLNADKLGFQKITAKLDVFDDEYSSLNNEKSVFIEVIDSRNNIGIYSESPHPDLSAFKSVLQRNQNFKIQIGNKKFWKEEKGKFNLIIIHNPNSLNKNDIDELINSKTPLLILVSTETNAISLKYLNVDYKVLSDKNEDVQATMNVGFSDFFFSENTLNQMKKFPPLKMKYNELFNFNNKNILFYQKLGEIIKDQPLLFFGNKNEVRIGVLLGENIWRWKITNYKNDGTTDAFDEIINKICSFLMVRKKELGLKINLPKRFNSEEEVQFNADFYNEALEPIIDPKISFELVNQNGNKLFYDFVSKSKSYYLNIGKLEPGKYDWIAKTTFGGKNYKKSGSFVIDKIEKEKTEFIANHHLLKSIAEESGGQFFKLENYSNLFQNIVDDKGTTITTYEEKKYEDWIEIIYFLIAILTLLTLEWILRRRFGTY